MKLANYFNTKQTKSKCLDAVPTFVRNVVIKSEKEHQRKEKAQTAQEMPDVMCIKEIEKLTVFVEML